MAADEVHPFICLLLTGSIISLHNRNWIVAKIITLLVISLTIRLSSHVANEHEGHDTEDEEKADRKYSQYIDYFLVGILSGWLVATGLKSQNLITYRMMADFVGFALTVIQIVLWVLPTLSFWFYPMPYGPITAGFFFIVWTIIFGNINRYRKNIFSHEDFAKAHYKAVLIYLLVVGCISSWIWESYISSEDSISFIFVYFGLSLLWGAYYHFFVRPNEVVVKSEEGHSGYV